MPGVGGGKQGLSRNRKLVFNENRVSVLQDAKSFGELWHNKVNILNPTEMVKMIKFNTLKNG